MSLTKQDLPIDSVLPAIQEAVAEWKLKNDKASIKRRVTTLLDNNSETVTMSLLGFSNRWDKWEIDHCNGRSGESAAGDYIRKVQADAVKEWLASIAMPVLDTKIKNKLLKEAQHEFESRLRSSVREAIRAKADACADELINSLGRSNNIDGILKSMSLINPTGEF